MHDVEYSYGTILLIFWVIVPAIISVFFFIYFARVSNTILHHKRSLDERKYHVKYGHTWTGKPYVKDFGYGTSFSKLSKDDYFKQL